MGAELLRLARGSIELQLRGLADRLVPGTLEHSIAIGGDLRLEVGELAEGLIRERVMLRWVRVQVEAKDPVGIFPGHTMSSGTRRTSS